MGLAIVAIPAEDDYVHKISSEKVAHLTLCYLGEPEGKPVQRIAAFLGHAVNIMEIGPFGLDVDYRGTLGPDNADVLFFKKAWSGKRVEEFRGQLLKNNDIRDAYDSVPQYSEWTPHLTLGYPETPAKEDNRDYPGIHWVQFDRIALWTGDSVGPEWRLQYNYDNDLAEVAMSSHAERGREFLEHFGVKGMKWGVRRNRPMAAVTTESRVNAGVRGKTKVKAKGGVAHPASPDAVKAASLKQKHKKSGAAALSNNELRELATRLQLEQQVKVLNAQSKSSGKKFVKETLADTGKQQSRRVFNAQVGKRVAKAGLAAA